MQKSQDMGPMLVKFTCHFGSASAYTFLADSNFKHRSGHVDSTQVSKGRWNYGLKIDPNDLKALKRVVALCSQKKICASKGQLISKGNFGVFNSSKKRTWKLKFLP